MRTLVLSTSIVMLALLGVVTPLQAQDEDYSGSYTLEGRFGWYGPEFDTALKLKKLEDGTYEVQRTFRYADDSPGAELKGTGKVEKVRRRAPGNHRWKTQLRLKVTFPATSGASEALEAATAGEETERKEDLTGTYTVSDDGRISGWVSVPNKEGHTRKVYESGKRTASSPTDTNEGDQPEPGTSGVKLLEPAAGVYLTGQTLRVRASSEDARVEVLEGEAKVDGQELKLTGPGKVRLQAKQGEQTSEVLELVVVTPEVIEITVLDTIELADAPPPHYKRAPGQEQVTWEPAAILEGERLRLRVRVAASADLTQAVNVELVAKQRKKVRLVAKTQLKVLSGEGQVVTLISDDVLNEAVSVNALELSWSCETDEEVELEPETELRVYTTYQEPVQNPLPHFTSGRRPLNSKLHFELACTWANGASSNIGNGSDSIGYQLDNRFRHHVAWEDYGTDGKWAPKVPHYPKGTPSPLNYAEMSRNTWKYGSVTRGEREVGRLFYPPLKPTQDYQRYAHFENNYGWWVLDNPRYTGGRCNQQASLIVDALGTLGIRGRVYYIERVGFGKKSGRAMRRWYRSSRSSKTWNFHGQAAMTLADGTQYLYDGSGSSPPDRINGRVEDLMAVPGRYVSYWEIWRYEDEDEWYAPMDDWPDTWDGVQIQKKEKPLDPQAKDGAYTMQLGTGTMDDGRKREFWLVNVGGRFITKIDKGTPQAETYSSAKHGKIGDWKDY